MTAKIGSTVTATAGMDPCWVLGYPKSGTTLLLSLLDGHAKLSVFPEELRYFSTVCGMADRIGEILSNTGFRDLLSGGKVLAAALIAGSILALAQTLVEIEIDRKQGDRLKPED